MSNVKSSLAVIAVAAAAISSFAVALPSYAEGEEENQNLFVTVHEAHTEARVSRSEVLAKVERIFDRIDAKKQGKLDKDQYELFLKELTAESGS